MGLFERGLNESSLMQVKILFTRDEPFPDKRLQAIEIP